MIFPINNMLPFEFSLIAIGVMQLQKCQAHYLTPYVKTAPVITSTVLHHKY